MKKILVLSFTAAVVITTSCKLAEPIGKSASVNKTTSPISIDNTQFISDVAVIGGTNVITQNEIAPPYTIAQVKEEQSQSTFSVFNLSETMQQMNRRSKVLYDQIDKWYGTPYRYGGTTSKGIDCSAFMQKLFSTVYKYNLPRTAREQYSHSKPIKKLSDLREGDLVFFKIRTSHISHVGIYLSDGKFAHSSCSQGVVISDLSSNYWSKYYVSGGRMEEAIYALN